MKIAVFDTHKYDSEYLNLANQTYRHELIFFETRLNAQTADLAQGCDAVCPFVNDTLDAATLQRLQHHGIKLVTLRAAGYNKIDLRAAAAQGIKVTRVPGYSPYAVAEHAFALLLGLVRCIPRANARVRDSNFALDGLQGFDLHGKTFGIIGFGRIGQITAQIAKGFGCEVIVHSSQEDSDLAQAMGVTFVDLPTLLKSSRIISLHVPLTPSSRYIINGAAIAQMQTGAILINTSRGGLIDTIAMIQGLKTGKLGGVGLDVYELEEGVFFENLSGTVLQDDDLARLLTFPNVLLTSHQAFLTAEALHNIAETTLANATAFEKGEALENEVLYG